MKSSHYRSLGFLFVGMIMISIGPVLVKFSQLNGNSAAFLRMLCGFLIMQLLFFGARDRTKSHEIGISKIGFPLLELTITGGIFGLNITCWNNAVVAGNASVGTIMASTSPIWLGFWYLLTHKQKIHYNYWLGVGITLIGLIIHSTLNIPGNTEVLLYGLVAGILYAIYLERIEYHRKQFESFAIAYGVSLGSVLILLPITISDLHSSLHLIHSPWWVTTAIVITFGVTHVGAVLSVNEAMQHISSLIVSNLMTLCPILTGFFAYILLEEKMSAQQLVGCAMMLLGIFLALQAILKKQTPGE